MMFKEQAESCRRQANDFVGRPEAPFLLSVAKAFEDLATGPDSRRFLVTNERGERDKLPA